ncbi:hypothetical protein ACJMK2_033029 [Sinanodonta woodiana]|uniref:NTR domain-containing protein n=1 Tax=Sinanodonta woodiana TaxID=1069815 RepID=A0ABD3X743_SINWO
MIRRQEMFVRFMLIVLTAIHVTSACDCSMLSWEELMCPASNKTVVLARLIVSSGELYNGDGHYVTDASSAVQGRYQLTLNTIFKNGSVPLLELSGQITMVFPVQDNSCGYHFTEDNDYVIGGDVHDGGILESSRCQLLIPYESIANNRQVINILQGETTPSCDNL